MALSYQHAYHAGNRADVLKHAVLDALLADLAGSGKPTLYIETHSGRAVYDLEGKEAAKTGEARAGVLDLLARPDPPPALNAWLGQVRAAGTRAYPGSPALAAAHLGEAGRLFLFEKHPAEFAALEAHFAGDRRVQVKQTDGYSGALRLSPRRGEQMAVFVDPSYETIADMETLADWAPRALARWPKAQLVLWLPLFKDGREEEFGAYLASLEAGIVAGARWPEASDKDSALTGSAIIAYRTPETVGRKAARIAAALDQYWRD